MSFTMIILDTETTNLAQPEAAPLEQQPRIIEFAAIRVDPKTLKEVQRFEFLCNPRVPIPMDSIKITGITNEMVKDCAPFASYIPALAEFFLGARFLVAHNAAFDVTVLRHELERVGRVTQFPWPPFHICTVEKTINLKGHRLKLGDMYKELTGKEQGEAHRAMKDVETLYACVKALHKKRML